MDSTPATDPSEDLCAHTGTSVENSLLSRVQVMGEGSGHGETYWTLQTPARGHSITNEGF